ncbi:MAG: hypothetical protein ACTSPQ_09360 [Candidatus Helarchaeota archaeon]
MDDIKNEDLLFDKLLSSLNFKGLLIHIVLPLLLSLFFIESLRAYVPGIYIQLFHVVFQDEGWEFSLLSLLTMALFALPLFTKILSKKFGTERIMLVSIILISLSRLLIACRISAIIETTLAALTIGVYGMYVGTYIGFLLTNKTKLSNTDKVSTFIISFIAAVLLDFLIRTLGFTLDITLTTWPIDPLNWTNYQYLWLIFQIPLSIIVILIPILYWKKVAKEYTPLDSGSSEKTGKNLIAAVSGVGLGIIWFLEFNILLYANAIAQFTSTNYFIMNCIVIAVITLTCFLLLTIRKRLILNKILIIVSNLLFAVIFIVFLYFGHLLTYLASILISISLVFVYFDIFYLLEFAGTKGKKMNKIRMISNVFAISFGVFLLFSFLYDFTTDWSFTIRSFRDMGPPILLISVIILVAMTLITLVYKKRRDEE